MPKIIFFDTTWNQLLRVGNLVAKEIKEISNVTCYGLVYETSGKRVAPEKDDTFFDDYLVTTQLSDIETYINKKTPEVVVFAQNTIPDLAAILFSQKIGAKIAMMQHGVLYDGATLNNVRAGEILMALTKASKTFDYLNIVRKMCQYKGQSFLKALKTIISEKDNVTTTIQNYFTPPLRGDRAFVIGEHWVDYYHENYGYSKEDIYIMGNHDVDDLEEGREIEDAICYIPSVHVEDGHVMESVFVDFLKNLAKAIPSDKKLYVKFHPRSNEALYKEPLKGVNVEYISGKYLPYVKTYIGHNSSLLSKALQISGILILWGFKEEKELFFKDYAFAVCCDGDSLSKAVSCAVNSVGTDRKASIEKLSYHNPEGAYRSCAKQIIKSCL